MITFCPKEKSSKFAGVLLELYKVRRKYVENEGFILYCKTCFYCVMFSGDQAVV